jgi:hemerythrin
MNVEKNPDLVEWKDSYSVGIKAMDAQHKGLLQMSNDLFTGCLLGGSTAKEYFKMTVHKSVEYVRYHFMTEETFLEKIGYPVLAEHKKQHEAFVKELLSQVKNFEDGQKFVPNNFARYLRDWVLTHIAVEDKQYAAFYTERLKEGFTISLS